MLAMQFGTAFITALASLPGGLRDDLAEGFAPLGTLPTEQLPEYLPDGPMVNGYPWGVEHSSQDAHSLNGFDIRDGDAATAGNAVDSSSSNACGSTPNTGVVRSYDWTVTRGFLAPDGFNKSVIFINGQFPGPTLQANWGDTIQVRVTNKIDSEMLEGISIHWHGLTQVKTPWYDGVPGVAQCPIAPGSTFTYTFQADQYGTSWYHSHYSAQYTDGLTGPIVIYGPRHVPYDIDLGPVFINDYIHQSYYSVLQNAYLKPPVFPNVDNNLINGKGMIDTGAVAPQTSTPSTAGSLAKFDFTTGKVHRLRVINAGSGGTQKFSIDNHILTVITQDFVPIKPYTTKVLTLGIGQRADVLVTANGKPTDAVWMRSDIDVVCLNLTTTISTALAPVYYPKASKISVPKTQRYSWSSNSCQNDALNLTTPYCPMLLTRPSTTRPILITLLPNGTGNLIFQMDGSSFQADYNDPILLDAKNGQSRFPRARNVYNFGSNSSVRVILNNVAPAPHPIHLHGHNFQVLAEGRGKWDGNIINPQNPLRRDTYLMQPGTDQNPAYLVLQWDQNNPGVWPLHCHISLHVSVGLYINVLELPDQIKNRMDIPMVMAQTCRDWQNFTKTHKVDQIDSGV